MKWFNETFFGIQSVQQVHTWYNIMHVNAESSIWIVCSKGSANVSERELDWLPLLHIRRTFVVYLKPYESP